MKLLDVLEENYEIKEEYIGLFRNAFEPDIRWYPYDLTPYFTYCVDDIDDDYVFNMDRDLPIYLKYNGELYILNECYDDKIDMDICDNADFLAAVQNNLINDENIIDWAEGLEWEDSLTDDGELVDGFENLWGNTISNYVLNKYKTGE